MSVCVCVCVCVCVWMWTCVRLEVRGGRMREGEAEELRMVLVS